jgi:hypothetical protein
VTVRITALALLPLLVAACSSVEHRSAPPREPTTAEQSLLHNAEQELLRRCMERHGFRYRPVPPMTGLLRFPYFVSNVDWARRHGFGLRLAAGLPRSDPNARYFESLSPKRRVAALAAANGPRPDGLEAHLPGGGLVRHSDRGCTSEAEARLYGDLERWFRAERVVSALAPLRRERVVAHPRYRSTVAAWSRCMRPRGYRAATPAELRASVVGRQSEARAAVAEATCARRSGLTATARRLDARFMQKLERSHRSAVTTKRRLELEALPRAQAVVAQRKEDVR